MQVSSIHDRHLIRKVKFEMRKHQGLHKMFLINISSNLVLINKISTTVEMWPWKRIWRTLFIGCRHHFFLWRHNLAYINIYSHEVNSYSYCTYTDKSIKTFLVFYPFISHPSLLSLKQSFSTWGQESHTRYVH